MKMVIAGAGYVGLSNAILLAQHNEVVAIDIVPEKVEMLNRKLSPIEDIEIEDYLTVQMTRREVLIWGRLPNWTGLGIYTLAATAVAWAGYAWFQKTRKGFADVL